MDMQRKAVFSQLLLREDGARRSVFPADGAEPRAAICPQNAQNNVESVFYKTPAEIYSLGVN